MENTKISYLYRDADNYKVYNECVIQGPMSKEQQNTIMNCLDENIWFIPSQVGLPGKQFDTYDMQSDHPFFELLGFEPTNEPATVDVTAGSLAIAFRKAKDRWDIEGAVFSRIQSLEEKVDDAQKRSNAAIALPARRDSEISH